MRREILPTGWLLKWTPKPGQPNKSENRALEQSGRGSPEMSRQPRTLGASLKVKVAQADVKGDRTTAPLAAEFGQ